MTYRIASYHFATINADSKTINYRIYPGFVSPEVPKARANDGINFMIIILIFVKNCLWYDAIHNFSIWLRTASNPADINQFQSHTGNTLYLARLGEGLGSRRLGSNSILEPSAVVRRVLHSRNIGNNSIAQQGSKGIRQ